MEKGKKKSRLQKRREELKLTQEEVARRAKITRQYYGMIENGLRDPSLKTARKLSKILGWGVDALFLDR